LVVERDRRRRGASAIEALEGLLVGKPAAWLTVLGVLAPDAPAP
jgi:hypothetical protein